MKKKYTSLGLMSGTSGDGIDASIINSNGIDEFEVIKNKYFEYDSDIYEKLHSIKGKIYNLNDLKKFSNELDDLERKITLYHAKIINEFKCEKKINYKKLIEDTINIYDKYNYIIKECFNGNNIYQLTLSQQLNKYFDTVIKDEAIYSYLVLFINDLSALTISKSKFILLLKSSI